MRAEMHSDAMERQGITIHLIRDESYLRADVSFHYRNEYERCIKVSKELDRTSGVRRVRDME